MTGGAESDWGLGLEGVGAEVLGPLPVPWEAPLPFPSPRPSPFHLPSGIPYLWKTLGRAPVALGATSCNPRNGTSHDIYKLGWENLQDFPCAFPPHSFQASHQLSLPKGLDQNFATEEPTSRAFPLPSLGPSGLALVVGLGLGEWDGLVWELVLGVRGTLGLVSHLSWGTPPGLTWDLVFGLPRR